MSLTIKYCFHNGFCENEIDHIFVAILNDEEFSSLKIKANSAEVASFIWMDWQEVKNYHIDNKKNTPWFNLFLGNQKINNTINQIVKNASNK